jgi:hypothetical protein
MYTGKMAVLGGLLTAIIAAGDRAVVVSGSTQALDCIDKLDLTPRG